VLTATRRAISGGHVEIPFVQWESSYGMPDFRQVVRPVDALPPAIVAAIQGPGTLAEGEAEPCEIQREILPARGGILRDQESAHRRQIITAEH